MTKENDIVLYPFVGSGSSFVASLLHNRKCAGSEIEEKYIDIVKNRIQKTLNDEIRIRAMNKPIYQPNNLDT